MKNTIVWLGLVLNTVVMTTPVSAQEDLKEVAYQAFIYAYPMIEQVKTINDMKQVYPGLGPNTIYRGPDYPMDNIGQPIVAPNFTSMVSLTLLDLSGGPVIFEVPEVKDRYIVHQAIDVFTYNFFYMGTRADGGEAGTYVFYNEDQEIPDELDAKPVRVSQDFAVVVTRIDIKDRSELDRVHAIQNAIQVTPLSLKVATYPTYDKTKEYSPAFVSYLNDLIVHVPESEQALFEKFKAIGVGQQVVLSATDSIAIQAGIDSAYATITATKFDIGNGWTGATDLFGAREDLGDHYLKRAVGAYFGLWGNTKSEANYFMLFAEGEGTLTFSKDALPPLAALGFFSLTIYDSTAHATANAYHSYVLTMDQLVYEADGSLVIHVSRSPQPGNWLYMPTEQFDLLLRAYMADPDRIGNYVPPKYVPKN